MIAIFKSIVERIAGVGVIVATATILTGATATAATGSVVITSSSGVQSIGNPAPGCHPVSTPDDATVQNNTDSTIVLYRDPGCTGADSLTLPSSRSAKFAPQSILVLT